MLSNEACFGGMTKASRMDYWHRTPTSLACSALKEKYRTTLQSKSLEPLHWVFLHGPKELLLERMGKRKGHYMHAGMLNSQLETLEKPTYALQLSIEHTPEELVEQIVAALEKDPAVGTKAAV